MDPNHDLQDTSNKIYLTQVTYTVNSDSLIGNYKTVQLKQMCGMRKNLTVKSYSGFVKVCLNVE